MIVVPNQSFQFQASLAHYISASYGFRMPPEHRHESKPKYETYRGKKSKHSSFVRTMTILTVHLSYMLMLLRDSQENEAQDDENKSNENKDTVAH